jgi:di/tripeptidase
MRDVEKKHLPHPLAPLLKTLGMARRAKPSALAGKHQQMFLPAARAPDPSKSAAGVAAVKIALDDLLDDRPEITIVPLEPALVFGDEPLEMMKKHPVENGAFRMTRAVDSRHIGNEVPRNAPGTGKGKNPGTAIRNGTGHVSKSVESVNVC